MKFLQNNFISRDQSIMVGVTFLALVVLLHLQEGIFNGYGSK